MFSSWKEYRDYLLEMMVQEPYRTAMRNRFLRMDVAYDGMKCKSIMYRKHISSILVNDYFMTKIDNFESDPRLYVWRKFRKTGTVDARDRGNPYIFGTEDN
jgi:hypothetical protein